MHVKEFLFTAIVFLVLSACQQHNQKNTGIHIRKYIDPANMDTTIRPGDDFYKYANGTWLKNNPIPETEAIWGTGNVLSEKIDKELHSILDSLAAINNAAPGSIAQKVGDFYLTGMDSDAINKAGIKPISDILARIDAIKDAETLKAEIALQHTNGFGTLFSFSISPDDKNVTNESCQFGQGGLGLPGREYYFDKDANTSKIREAYKKYIENILILTGQDKANASKNAANIYKLELSLASATMTKVELRDPNTQYNKFNLDGINRLTPGLDWKVLVNQLKLLLKNK